jgi:hypothetical protein
MHKIIQEFIIKLFFITLIVLCIACGIFYFFGAIYYFDLFPVVLVIFPIISFIVHYRLLKTSQNSIAKFNVAFMSSFMLKLFIYSGMTALIIYIDRDLKKSIVLTVLLIYLVFTVFETRQILIDIKRLVGEKE